MPTSTVTMTIPATTKVSKLPMSVRKSPPSKSAVATLRSLYPRAARAFLQRDVTLTQSLLLSAFSNLQPPVSSILDPLSSHRRKWDILRITLETTLYTAALPKQTLPESLQSVLLLSPTSLVTTMHARSLQLFTPAVWGKPNAESLPSQILVALVLASVKLDCVQVGREMIENWLSCRNRSGYDTFKEEKQANEDTEGYEKVLEMYCLHVLPRLDDWDYAREFLRYESDLPPSRRTYLVQSLQVLHSQHLTHIEEVRERQRKNQSSPSSSRTPTPKPFNNRAPSPSPSLTSTSSTSTHTAVPLTPRPHAPPSPFTSLTSTPRNPSPAQSGLNQSATIARRQSRTPTPLPTPLSAPQMPVSTISPPSLLTLIKTSLLPHLTKSNLTFMVIMFLVPVVSFLLRLRRRRLFLLRHGVSAAVVAQPRRNAAEEAKRRLRPGWWGEIRKAVTDAVTMAAGGLT